MSRLSADNLSKQYKGRRVVAGVSLEIKSGEIVGLLGPNGAGKTTCFYMIVGLVPVDGGSIALDDTDVSSLPMHRRARLGVGYLPQEPSVFRHLTVEKNIMAILATHAELTVDHARAPVSKNCCTTCISPSGVTPSASASPAASAGAWKNARARARGPRSILLDEPFAGVDPISVVEIQNLIRHLQKRGIGVLITDHNVRETLKICDHAYIMSDGKVLTAGTPKKILYNEDVRRVYLGEDFKL